MLAHINNAHKQHKQQMYMTMTMMRPGLFSQREGPGSEPGNSLLRPDGVSCMLCAVSLGGTSVERAYSINSINRGNNQCGATHPPGGTSAERHTATPPVSIVGGREKQSWRKLGELRGGF